MGNDACFYCTWRRKVGVGEPALPELTARAEKVNHIASEELKHRPGAKRLRPLPIASS